MTRSDLAMTAITMRSLAVGPLFVCKVPSLRMPFAGNRRRWHKVGAMLVQRLRRWIHFFWGTIMFLIQGCCSIIPCRNGRCSVTPSWRHQTLWTSRSILNDLCASELDAPRISTADIIMSSTARNLALLLHIGDRRPIAVSYPFLHIAATPQHK